MISAITSIKRYFVEEKNREKARNPRDLYYPNPDMVKAIRSVKRYWFVRQNRQENSEWHYLREVRNSDRTDFQPCVLKKADGNFSEGHYFNPKTKELSKRNPAESVIPMSHYGFKIENVFKTTIKATAIGFVASGSSILLGYSIVSLCKGTLIGFSAGAMKSFWDAIGWDEELLYVTKNKDVIATVRKPNGDPFPEADSNVEHTS